MLFTFWRIPCAVRDATNKTFLFLRFAPVPVCANVDEECLVKRIELPVLATVELIRYYQEWSQIISTRITPNLEVLNSTHLQVTGVFLGTDEMWEEAVLKSGATEDTPIKASQLLNAGETVEFAQALTDLTGWTYDLTPDVLVLPYLERRTYFKYKSLWLFEPLPDEALQMLIEDAMLFPGAPETFVIFEYQALGGDPGYNASSPDEYPVYSPKNLFSTVPPKDTAFPHRGAKHCLMFKSQSADATLGNDMLRHMERIFQNIKQLTAGQASYYNHIDSSLPLETPYFRDGVELNPGVSTSDRDYWVSRLAEVRLKYNPNGMLVNELGVGLSSTGNACPINDGSGDDGSGGMEQVGSIGLATVVTLVWMLF